MQKNMLGLGEALAVTEILRANVSEVYKDAAQPSVRILGKTLAQCISLFATPVGRMAEIFEKNIHRYLDKLEGLKADEIVSPNTRVLVPILEKLRYTDDELIADYYTEILAMASTKKNANKVLISFIEILNRLSADEIRILEYINSKDNVIDIEAITEADAKNYSGFQVGDTITCLSGGFPVIDIELYSNNNSGFQLIGRNFNILCDKLRLDCPENIDFYIDNMMSLGLLEKRPNFKYALYKIYRSLKKHKEVENFRKTLLEGQRIELSEGRIDVTDLGRKLLELCSRGNKK